MNPGTTLAVILVTASLFGCTHSPNQSVNLSLAATHKNPGQIAKSTLTSTGNQTNFDFYITGVPSGTILPPRIYTFINRGSCQQPGPAAYAMNDKVNTESNAGTSGWSFYRSAPISLSDLLSDKYSIVVRTAPEDGSVDIFCGDIKKAN